ATSGGALQMGGGSVAGNLSLNSGGPITQGAPLSVAGTSTIDAETNAITFQTAGNHFDGVVHLTGGETQILSDGALSLGVLNVASLSARTNGVLDAGSGIVSGIMSAQGTSVSQSGALVVGGASLFAGSAGVTLANAGNDFIGAVHLTGGSDTT